jgi:hypothetical protein
MEKKNRMPPKKGQMDEWTNGRFGVFRWCYGEEGGKISAMIEYTIIIIILYII